MPVQPYQAHLIEPLTDLVNLHLAAALPGWRLDAATLANHLERDRDEYVVDPWVVERTTLCVPDGYRVAAAAHLLRFGDMPDVAPHYRATAEVGWFLFRPGSDDAARELFAAVHAQFADWHTRDPRGWGSGLPVPSLSGIPDAWPHIVGALREAGYAPGPDMRREALYAGALARIDAPSAPPIPGLELSRRVGPHATWFEVTLAGADRVAFGQFAAHANGWADGWDLLVEPAYRRRGIGRWLMRHVAAYLRLSGCDRLLVPVTDEDEQAGAGPFYRRLGLEVLTRDTIGWRRQP